MWRAHTVFFLTFFLRNSHFLVLRIFSHFLNYRLLKNEKSRFTLIRYRLGEEMVYIFELITINAHVICSEGQGDRLANNNRSLCQIGIFYYGNIA